MNWSFHCITGNGVLITEGRYITLTTAKAQSDYIQPANKRLILCSQHNILFLSELASHLMGDRMVTPTLPILTG